MDKKPIIIILLVVVVGYVIFASGMVFELAKKDTVGEMDIPYAIAFSNERLGLIGVYNEDDIRCVEWLVDNYDTTMPIKSDYFGYLLFLGYNGIGTNYYKEFNKSHYLYLGTWNSELNKVILGWDAGIRRYEPLPDVSKAVELHREGQAVVYKITAEK